MILSRNEILKLVKSKKIAITPFKEENIGPASIDLTLGKEFRVYKKKSKIDMNENTDYKDYTEQIVTDSITLKPNEFILGISEERIKLPDNICGTLCGRSRFARLGLIIHATASFIQPGIDNKQVFEIKNLSENDIILHAGTRISQLSLEQMKGKAKYNGSYKNQVKP